MDSYQKGIFSEIVACAYLMLHGFKIVKRRYTTGRHTGRAEIDIIARRGNLIVFIEVKKRKTISAGFDAITWTQIKRLRAAAETYLLQKRWMGDARFDVIIIHGWKITWVKQVF